MFALVPEPYIVKDVSASMPDEAPQDTTWIKGLAPTLMMSRCVEDSKVGPLGFRTLDLANM